MAKVQNYILAYNTAFTEYLRFMYTTAQRPALLSRDIITFMGSNLLHRAACIIHIHILLLGSNRHCRPWSPPTNIHNTPIHIVHQVVLLYAMLRPTGQPPVKPHIIVCSIFHHVSSRHLKITSNALAHNSCSGKRQSRLQHSTLNIQHCPRQPFNIQHSTFIRSILRLKYHTRLYHFHRMPCAFGYLASILCLSRT